MFHNAVGVQPDGGDTLQMNPEGLRLAARSYGLTDPGKVRETNQDQFLIASLVKTLRIRQTSLPAQKIRNASDESRLFIVADGMGGHAGGEHASALAVDAVEAFVLDAFKWFSKCRGRDQDQVLADFQTALREANARVLAEGHECPDLRGMGTTLTLAYSLNDTLFVAHVGDSRCYLHRNGVLNRITRDHTLVEDLIRRGAIAPEEGPRHRWRHVVTNAIGGDSPELQVEVHKIQLEAGDILLLCSDGLTEMLSDGELSEALATIADPEHACQHLVAVANEKGGKDNVTVLIARFDASDEPRETG